jgi:quercetin dioxygenase-like cupin family protein
MKHRFALFASALAALAIIVATIPTTTLAQQGGGITRTLLLKRDLSVEGREAVMGTAELAPGASAGKHIHHGEEVGYVLEGNLTLEIDGEAPLTLKPGDTYSIPAARPHDAKNAGGGSTKVLAVYIVEKGKPLAEPVK